MNYAVNGSFTVGSGYTCSAYINIKSGAGIPISNDKVGCMLNSGSLALPFSEYTDIAVVK